MHNNPNVLAPMIFSRLLQVWIHSRLLYTLQFIFVLVVVGSPMRGVAEPLLSPSKPPPAAQEIAHQVYHLYGGDDYIGRLNFVFKPAHSQEKEKHLTYLTAWKKYPAESNFVYKVLMIKESPAEGKGIAYMQYRYRAPLNKNDEEWLYLPELRMTRKLSHNSDSTKKDEEFTPSVLLQQDLEPHDPDTRTHVLLRQEICNDAPCYVIESTPNGQQNDFYPYSKTVTWVSALHFTPWQVEAYNLAGHLEKRIRYKWTQIGKAWVWQELSAENVRLGTQTVLTISDVRVNANLPDTLFTKRSLEQGGLAIK